MSAAGAPVADVDAAVWTAIGLLAAFSFGSLFYHGTIDALASRMDARFDRIDARFDHVDRRFDAVDARLDAVNARIDTHLERHST